MSLEAKPNFRSLGKKFGKSTPLAARAVAAFGDEELRTFERGEPLVVSVDGESHQLEAEDLTIVRRASGAFVVEEDAGFIAALDPTITPELKIEGYARELISRVQRMRKDAGFAVSDRIALTVVGGGEVKAVIDAHGGRIADEVLATRLDVRVDERSSADVERSGDFGELQRIDLDGITAHVAITRIQ